MIRPSSLPMLAQCPCWESDNSTGESDKSGGTVRHNLLALSLTSQPMPPDTDEDDAASVEWARDYITCHSSAEHKLEIEQSRTLLDDSFERVMSGTPDVVAGPVVFDLKTRERDYNAQMAAYALMVMDERDIDEITVHLLYTATRRAVTFKVNRADARALVFGIIARVNAEDKQPTSNDYCGWCSRRLTCPALLAVAQKVARNYSDDPKIQNWHPSQMLTGEELAEALTVVRVCLKKWCESVEYHALQAATKQGITLPGYELATRKGKTYVPDVPQAFTLSGLPQDEFLKGCQVRLSTSKSYPDQLGLVDIFAGFNGLKKAAAKRDLMKRLEPVAKQTKDTQNLRAVKGEASEEGDE